MNTVRAHDVVAQWLAAEHPYQFDEAHQVFGDDGDIEWRLGFIMELEMPGKWQRQLTFRMQAAEKVMLMQAGQQVLKVCAAARAALIYSQVLDGESFQAANQQSWRVVESTLHDEGAMDHYQAKLYGPFEQAVGTTEYTCDNRREQVEPALVHAIGLAAANLYEVRLMTGSEILPAPGVPSGELHDWLAPVHHRT